MTGNEFEMIMEQFREMRIENRDMRKEIKSFTTRLSKIEHFKSKLVGGVAVCLFVVELAKYKFLK